MQYAGLAPTLTEVGTLPNPVAQALAFVGGWREEISAERQANLLARLFKGKK